MPPKLSLKPASQEKEVTLQEHEVCANALEKLLPVLVYIQANLDGDLSLEAVANESASHHSTFTGFFARRSAKH